VNVLKRTQLIFTHRKTVSEENNVHIYGKRSSKAKTKQTGSMFL